MKLTVIVISAIGAVLAVGCQTRPENAASLPVERVASEPVQPPAEEGIKTHEIRFARGSRSATVDGAVIRGETDLYTIGAKAGQTIRVAVTAVENNAAFAIYVPGHQAVMDDGAVEIRGTSLPGAGDGDDATNWKGRLPASGQYLISVGGTRGNATYQLQVGIE